MAYIFLPPIYLVFLIFPSLSHQSATTHLLSSSLLPWLCKTPWWILASHPHFKRMKMQTGLCHQFTLFPLSSASTRNAKLCSSSHMNQSKPPSGNVCWSFQVPFQTRECEGEGEIKLEQVREARDSDRETTSRETERDRPCRLFIEDAACVSLVFLFSKDTVYHN